MITYKKSRHGVENSKIDIRFYEHCSSTLHEIETAQIADYKDKSTSKKVMCSRFERRNPL
jgi:hypothetical protein